MFKGKTILITGGTGSFGNRILKRLLPLNPKEIRVYSRDEKKQYDMKYGDYQGIKNISFFVGDVRDRKRLGEVIAGCDIAYHAAALKQVPSCEYCPEEAVKTNINGAINLIDCAIEAGVKKVVAISTDKAVKPVNVMGMTKAVQEKLITAANDIPKNKTTIFSCVRYGNVMGSRGSAIPFFRKLIKEGKEVTITHPEMTRFMLTLDDAIDLVFFATEHMKGGEIFVKKAPSTKMVDLARMLFKQIKGSDSGFKYKIIGTYPGEKIHEILISEEERGRSVDKGDFFIIKKFEKMEHIEGPYDEYSSKNVITAEQDIMKLLQKADKAVQEDVHKLGIYTK